MLRTTFDAKNRIWKGQSLPYPFEEDVFLGEKIFENLRKNPDRVIQIYHDEDIHLTAGEFLTSVIRVAQNLSELGMQSNDVAGVCCLNTNETVIFINACVMLGIIPNPLDVLFGPEDICYVFEKTMPKLIVCENNVHLKIKDALKHVKNDAAKIFTMDKVAGINSFDELLKPTGIEDQFVPPKFNESVFDKVLAILCSSGTTGYCKAVSITHARMIPTDEEPAGNYQISRILQFSSAHWITAFWPIVTVSFPQFGVNVITSRQFSVDILIEIVEKHKVTTAILPPPRASMMVQSNEFLQSDFSSLERICISGMIVSSTLREKLKQNMPKVKICIRYGLTEYTVTSFEECLSRKSDTSVGKILNNNVEVKIVDDDGNRLSVNQQGELCVRNVVCPFMGYYGNPNATEDAIDAEGFFKSGDIGYFDEEGHLYIVDRKKDTLRYYGYHYSPSEIEEVIQQIEGVKLVSVVGVPDPVMVCRPTAVVVRLPEYENELTEDFIKSFVASKLSFYKHLHGGVRFVDHLPMTASGKIQKRKVLEMLMKE